MKRNASKEVEFAVCDKERCQRENFVTIDVCNTGLGFNLWQKQQSEEKMKDIPIKVL